jgi:hypothetical protein
MPARYQVSLGTRQSREGAFTLGHRSFTGPSDRSICKIAAFEAGRAEVLMGATGSRDAIGLPALTSFFDLRLRLELKGLGTAFAAARPISCAATGEDQSYSAHARQRRCGCGDRRCSHGLGVARMARAWAQTAPWKPEIFRTGRGSGADQHYGYVHLGWKWPQRQ